MLLSDLHDRLRAVLPDTVPILLPGQMLEPPQWQEVDEHGDFVEDGREGLHVYLEQKAPGGYVQLYDLGGGFTMSGWSDSHILTIDTIAPTEAQARVLAQQVRSRIGGTPHTGGPIRVFTPPSVTSRDSVSVRVTTQYTVRSAHPR